MNGDQSMRWLHDLGIVIPTLNAAQFLPDTLASVSKLVAAGATAVIVDGGSVDETKPIAVRHGFVVLDEPCPGLYAALNKGFRHLGARWLTWINADDILFASGISLYGINLEDADVHYGTVDFIDTEGRFLHAWRSAAPQRLRSLFRAGCSPLLQQGTIFRREVFETLDGFDTRIKYVADADFWWRAVEAGFRFRRLSRPPVAGFRLHPSQITQRHADVMRMEHEAMVAARRGRPRCCAASLAALLYRLSNLSRYAVRVLRFRDLASGWKLPRSYDAF